MKQNFLLLLVTTATFANINNLTSFESDFQQKIVDDQNKTILYSGHIIAAKPQYALWKYKKPIQKSVYILEDRAIMIEPDLEQAIIKSIGRNFDFFSLLQHAKKISPNQYLARYNDTTFIIKVKNGVIQTISYKDEFENSVIIKFTHQQENIAIDKKRFEPVIPDDYDIVRE